MQKDVNHFVSWMYSMGVPTSCLKTHHLNVFCWGKFIWDIWTLLEMYVLDSTMFSISFNIDINIDVEIYLEREHFLWFLYLK